MLEWSEVAETLSRARLYWTSTVGMTTPHLTPIHAAFTRDHIFLTGDPLSRWSRNLEETPHIHVGVSEGARQIIVRGRARRHLPDADLFADITANLGSKYGWNLSEPVEAWDVTPRTVLAFDEESFATSPTRFSFEELR